MIAIRIDVTWLEVEIYSEVYAHCPAALLGDVSTMPPAPPAPPSPLLSEGRDHDIMTALDKERCAPCSGSVAGALSSDGCCGRRSSAPASLLPGSLGR